MKKLPDYWKDDTFRNTKLFGRSNNQFKIDIGHGSEEYPFSYTDKAIELINVFEYKRKDFNKAFEFQELITKKEWQSQFLFKIEIASVFYGNRNDYLNAVIQNLIKSHKNIRKLLNDHQRLEKPSNTELNNHSPLFSILENSILSNLNFLFQNHHSELNNSNYQYLNPLFIPREPIKSFKRVKYIKDENLKAIFEERLVKNGFISKQTTFSAFKSLFTEKLVHSRIEWTETFGALHYFITQLKDSNVIENPKNKHWEITSQFFTKNGIPVKNLKKQKEPRAELKKPIDRFITDFHSNFEKK